MKQIRIDLLQPIPKAVWLPRPPDGVRVGGLRSEISNGPIGDSLFVLVDVGKDVAIALFTSWLYDHIKEYRAKRIRINGREPSDRADFERIVADELEIGKND
jgi:hypothetical protein